MEWISDFLFVHDTFVRALLLDVILAYSLFVTFRAGMWSLAQAGVMAIAAYATAILTLDHGWSLLAAVPVAVLVGTIAGTVMTVPALRLEGAYLAIATIAFVELVRVAAINLDVTGGAGGLSGLPSDVTIGWLVVAAGAVALAVLLLTRSRLGLAMGLHSRSAVLAQAVGVDIRRLRLVLVVVSFVIAAFGASLGTHVFRVVVPNGYAFERVVELLTIVIVGGTASVLGPIVGVLLLRVPAEFIGALQGYEVLFDGVLLLLAILFFPGGITSPSQFRRPDALVRMLSGSGPAALARWVRPGRASAP